MSYLPNNAKELLDLAVDVKNDVDGFKKYLNSLNPLLFNTVVSSKEDIKRNEDIKTELNNFATNKRIDLLIPLDEHEHPEYFTIGKTTKLPGTAVIIGFAPVYLDVLYKDGWDVKCDLDDPSEIHHDYKIKFTLTVHE